MRRNGHETSKMQVLKLDRLAKYLGSYLACSPLFEVATLRSQKLAGCNHFPFRNHVVSAAPSRDHVLREVFFQGMSGLSP